MLNFNSTSADATTNYTVDSQCRIKLIKVSESVSDPLNTTCADAISFCKECRIEVRDDVVIMPSSSAPPKTEQRPEMQGQIDRGNGR